MRPDQIVYLERSCYRFRTGDRVSSGKCSIKNPGGANLRGVLCPDLGPGRVSDKKRSRGMILTLDYIVGVPTGSRTPVTGVKGPCPRPLDDGDVVGLTFK